MITISPRYLLLNRLPTSIYFQQAGHDHRWEVRPGKLVPLHWPNCKAARMISMSLSMGNHYSWSEPFKLDEMGEQYIKIFHLDDTSGSSASHSWKQENIVNVEKRLDGATVIITFSPKNSSLYPYRISNSTAEQVTFWQVENTKTRHVIPPGSTVDYFWDSPNKPRKIQVRVANTKFDRVIELDAISKYSSKSDKLKAEVYATGPTKGNTNK